MRDFIQINMKEGLHVLKNRLKKKQAGARINIIRFNSLDMENEELVPEAITTPESKHEREQSWVNYKQNTPVRVRSKNRGMYEFNTPTC